jgi:hypothetical protein
MKKNLDTSGCVVFALPTGTYSALISSEFLDGDNVCYANGAIADFFLDENGVSLKPNEAPGDSKIEVILNVSVSSAIIIREVYYAGSKNKNTGENYARDQYIELYNNSDFVYYLDSLFIGCIAPFNGISGSHPFAGYDTTPIADMHWMFPGNGTDYPLLPGESVVVAECAIAHPESNLELQLNRSHFAFYHFNLNTSIDPSVTALIRTYQTSSTRYPISVNSPAIVIYRIPNVAEYYETPEKWRRYEPGKTSGTLAWCIPQSWIIDGVECFQYGKDNKKRLREYVDASYNWLMSGQNMGLALTRKIQSTTDGKIKYKDTNNSLDDFEEHIADPHLRNN